MSMFLRKDLFMKILLRFLGSYRGAYEQRNNFCDHNDLIRHFTRFSKIVGRAIP